MNNWRVFSYIFFGCGSLLFIYALGTFFSKLSVIPQTPYFDQTLISTSLLAIVPYLILATIWYVIGSFGYYVGRKKIKHISQNKSDDTVTRTLDEIDA